MTKRLKPSKIFPSSLTLLLTAILLSAMSIAHAQASNEIEIEPRIIGGVDATTVYPWMVALSTYRNANSPDCGASLIDPNWAVTAAHCVVNGFGNPISPRDIEISIGDVNLVQNNSNEEYREISQIIVHEDYDTLSYNNDIALLKLATPSTKTPIKIISQSDFPVAGSSMRILGWGDTIADESNYNYPDILQQADITLINQAVCERNYQDTVAPVNDAKICAGVYDASRDSCAGDSGGPILHFLNNEWQLAGLTSYGRGCAEQGSYGVYTRITSFDNWIECKMNDECDDGNNEANNPFEAFIRFLAFLFSLLFPS